jgi:hypothetical protein
MIARTLKITTAVALLAFAATASAGPPHDDRGRHGPHAGLYDDRGALGHRAHPRRGHEGYRHEGYRHQGYRKAQHRQQQAHRYAAVSVDQARELRRLGHYPDHPRWSLNYEGHLHWALSQDGWRLEREIRRRAARLRELRIHYRGHRYQPYRRW